MTNGTRISRLLRLLFLLLPLAAAQLHPQETPEDWIVRMIIESYIRDQVEDLLQWDSRFRIDGLTVTVRDGTVTLTGTLNSELFRETVADVVMSVPGVRSVDDRTVVGPGADIGRILEENVRQAFATNPAMSRLPIEVAIFGDILFLTGRVDALWKKEKAQQVAAGVSGLQDIRNRLLVVPSNDIVDEWVARRIQRMLASSSYPDVRDVTVIVDRGRAVLVGTVESLTAKRAAYIAVLTTGGVAEIENRIEIRGGIASR